MRWIMLVLAIISCHHATTQGSATDAPSGLDGPSGRAGVGAPCSHNSDCTVNVFGTNAGQCIVDAPFVNGYCSAMIVECAAGSGGSPCPVGTACINPGIQATGGLDYCVERCTTNNDCRVSDGYTCCPNVEGHVGPFCYPSALCS